MISANLHGLVPKIANVSQWQADALLLQETWLTELGQVKAKAVMADAAWSAAKGKTEAIHGSTNKVASAANAARGGVAVVPKSHYTTHDRQTKEATAILKKEGG